MQHRGAVRHLKPREDRQRTVLPARLRTGSGWSDACILNISSRGLLVYSPSPATPGSYVEVGRGEHVIVARVVWRRNQRIGLSSHDWLPVAQIITGGHIAALARDAQNVQSERRLRARAHDRSRTRARLFEFGGIAFAGAALASLAYTTVADTLGKPIAMVSAALHKQ